MLQGSSDSTPIGGHEPNSIPGIKAELKYAQKKLKKRNISEIRNKATSRVCYMKP
jgi:hypothetical protein